MANELNGLNSYDAGAGKSCAFDRFQWVLEGKLARSSQPNYGGRDQVHTVGQQDVTFLQLMKIKCVISANEHEMNDAGRNALSGAKIAFHRFRVPDFGVPTADDFKAVANLIDQHPATLIYCGYGQGRTGTYVAGWAKLKHRPLVKGLDNPKFLEDRFGVEKPGQCQAIKSLV